MAKQDREFRNGWEQTRKLAFAMLQPHLKNRNITEKKLMPFAWDVEEVERGDVFETPEQVKDFLEHQREFYARIDELKSKNELKQEKFIGNGIS